MEILGASFHASSKKINTSQKKYRLSAEHPFKKIELGCVSRKHAYDGDVMGRSDIGLINREGGWGQDCDSMMCVCRSRAASVLLTASL